MSLTLAQQAEREEQITRELVKEGRRPAEARQLAQSAASTATAGARSAAEASSPRAWKPPLSPLEEMGLSAPGFEEAARSSARAGGLESKLAAASNPATEASAAAGGALIKGAEDTGKAIEEGAKAALKPAEWIGRLGELLSKLVDPAFMLRVLKVVAGGALVLVGVYLLVRAIAPGATPSITDAATTVATGPAGVARKAASTAGKGVRARAAANRRSQQPSSRRRTQVRTSESRRRAREAPRKGGKFTKKEG